MEVNFFKLYIGDYQRDTGTLTLAEHGAYTLMLQYFYATEAPLPTGRELHRLLRADTQVERKAIDAVAAKFWRVTGDGLVNDRAVEEIKKGSHQREVNREIGKRGGRPKQTESVSESVSETGTEHITESVSESVSEREPNDKPNRNPNHSHSQTPEINTPPYPPPTRGAVSETPGFSEFWATWPQCVRKQAKGRCLSAWQRAKAESLADEIVAHVRSLAASEDWRREGGRFIPAPLVYLNQRRWEGAETTHMNGSIGVSGSFV